MNGERVMSPGERSAYANGWQARDEEVAQLRVELEIWRRNGGDVLLKAEIDELKTALHYCNGTCDLAMKHRDVAEAEVKRLQGEIDVLLSKSKEAT